MNRLQLMAAIRESFERQMSTTSSGIKLRGSMDGAQHQWLERVITNVASNLAQSWQASDGYCCMCGAGFGEGTCPTCGAGDSVTRVGVDPAEAELLCHSCEENPHKPGCPYVEYLGAPRKR